MPPLSVSVSLTYNTYSWPQILVIIMPLEHALNLTNLLWFANQLTKKKIASDL